MPIKLVILICSIIHGPNVPLSPHRARIPIRSALSLTRGAGSSSGSSLGSGGTGDWQRISRPLSTPHTLFSTPLSCSSRVGLHGLHDFRNRFLTIRIGFHGSDNFRASRKVSSRLMEGPLNHLAGTMKLVDRI